MYPGKPNDDFNTEAFKHAIGMLESSGGKYLQSRYSSAVGKYHFLWKYIKDNPKLKGYTKRQFINDFDMQEELMNDAINGKLKGYPGYKNYAKKLKASYNSDLSLNELAALTHFLGSGNVRKYLKDPGSFKVDGKVNATAQEYVDRFNNFFNEYNSKNKRNTVPNIITNDNINKEIYNKNVQQKIDNTYVSNKTNINPKIEFDSSLLSNENLPNLNFQEDIDTYSKRQSEFNQMKHGGYSNSFSSEKDNLIRFESGGTHEQNPIGGIPQGIGANGKPNLVEEGETKWNDYVFSDSISIGGKIEPANADPQIFRDGGDLNKSSEKKSRLLLSGSVGDDVKRVQSFLGLKEDGIFGKNTKKAVMDFQRKNKLKVDGIVGKNTMKAFSDFFMKRNTGEEIKEEPLPKLEIFKGADSSEKNIKDISRKSVYDYLPKKDNTNLDKPFFRTLDKKLAKKAVTELSPQQIEREEKRNKSKRVSSFQRTLKERLGIGTSAIDGKWGKKTQASLEDLKKYVNSDLDETKFALSKSFKSGLGVKSGNLTEKNFSERELNLIKKILFKGGKMRNSFSYENARKAAGMKNFEVSDFITAPAEIIKNIDAVSLNLVLGSANAVEDNDGNVYVYDIYDFNDVGEYGKKDKRTPDEVYQDRIKYAESSGGMDGIKSIYSKFRANASKNQRQEQIEAYEKGERWKPKVTLINLGKKKDLIREFGSSRRS